MKNPIEMEQDCPIIVPLQGIISVNKNMGISNPADNMDRMDNIFQRLGVGRSIVTIPQDRSVEREMRVNEEM